MTTNLQNDYQPSDHYNDRAEHHGRRAESGRFAWSGGVVLIALGGIFLLQNMGILEMTANWWAIFLLLPALLSAITAWRIYRDAGRMTPAATGALTGSLVLGFLAAMFLLNLSWTVFWPMFLLIAGASALLNGLSWSREDRD
ncbi:MAG TPA: hypothetical protein VF897_11145 [Roseiflexaceae bacterium]